MNGDCELRLRNLKFLRHEPSSDDVSPSEEKITAIRDARPPKEASEARSLMGLVQYSAKFMPDRASIARPIIKDLNREGILFERGPEQHSSFQELKRSITQEKKTLALYQVRCRTRIIADDSTVGLGAVRTQQQGVG